MVRIVNDVNLIKVEMTLHELAEHGDRGQILRTLEREMDIDINEKDQFGRTALHWAAEQGHVGTVEVLLDMNADIYETENMGRTAVHLAARSGNAEVLQALFDHVEASQLYEVINVADHKGITPVFLAQQKGKDGEEAFYLLLKNGAVYNQQLDLHRVYSRSSEGN